MAFKMVYWKWLIFIMWVDENPLFYVIINNHIGGVFMKWRVGVYTRVSRDSEYSESNSIDNQL